MLTQTQTVCFRGIQAMGVSVQTQVAGGALPSFSIVGLPDKAISESRERIRAALFTLGLALPPKRIVINLAPANIQKEGSHYDLPMILSLLMALEVVPQELSAFVSLGELGLDASIKAVHGTLSAALFASSVGSPLICPAVCAGEATWGCSQEVLAPGSLLELINHFRGTQVLPVPTRSMEEEGPPYGDFSEIKGQEAVTRALLIAAAGGHNVLMTGPPGTGKSMMASRLNALLPPLSPKEALEVSMIHSMVADTPPRKLLSRRPFRNPHHSASMASIVGGGLRSTPGEISLAHTGILFLDELPEFNRLTLEALRQPLESGEAVIARANYHVTYPAQFQLIAAMNPCRCGHLGNINKQCAKAPACGALYRKNLSGPLLDRIDIFIDVPEVNITQLPDTPTKPINALLTAQVQKARLLQQQRYQKTTYTLNAQAMPAYLDKELKGDVHNILIRAADKWQLSMRSYYRIARVARTIADLENSDTIERPHVIEALSYRQ